MIYEQEFCRKKHRGGETIWSLRVNLEDGTIRVRSHKTLKDGPEILEMPPSLFAASGNGREHRTCQARLRKFVASFAKVETEKG